MGIRGFTKFVEEHFKGWQSCNSKEWERVVIDGNNICYQIYKERFTWLLGGEYCKFDAEVEKCLKKIKDDFKNPIVLLDGARVPCEKLSASLKRREQSIKEIKMVQGKKTWNYDLASNKEAAMPLMLSSVFLSVLRRLEITFEFSSDGETDKVIADRANAYECPVLACDSDYFIFPLKHGVIHFRHYYRSEGKKPLFDINKFMIEFSLKSHEQCLVLPSVFGNSSIVATKRSSTGNFAAVLLEIATCGSHEKFLEHHPQVSQNFEKARHFYCEVSNSVPGPRNALPEWVQSSFKCGCFMPFLLYVHQGNFHLLPRVIEVIDMDSAWRVSRYIRQYLYGLIELPPGKQVEERIRNDNSTDITTELVSPLRLIPAAKIGDPIFTERVENKLADLVLTVLKCHKIPEDEIDNIFNLMEDQWKLPIAATFYWYKSIPQDQKKNLLKSLLLSFLTCSEVISNAVPPLPPVDERTKGQHLRALHAFAKWQCVYYDARALNYLAREPFPTTSPASLYSGEVAMHYATTVGDWIASITKGSRGWSLFNDFLYLITGSDENGRSRRQRSWTVVCHAS